MFNSGQDPHRRQIAASHWSRKPHETQNVTEQAEQTGGQNGAAEQETGSENPFERELDRTGSAA